MGTSGELLATTGNFLKAHSLLGCVAVGQALRWTVVQRGISRGWRKGRDPWRKLSKVKIFS